MLKGISLLKKDSVQFSSVAQSCPTLCDPMNCSRPDLPVHHQLPEFTQTHAHWVGDAIQPSVIPFSSCPQSLPASVSFPMCQLLSCKLKTGSWARSFAIIWELDINTESQGPPRALLNRTCIWQNPQVNHTHIIVCWILSNFA